MSETKPASRIAEIDILRGLVIVLMALDHVRDYFFMGAFSIDPLNPEQTTPLLYATRWITHLCAPTFVLLAGVSAYLQRANGKPVGKLSALLLTRGIWLIVLELTIISIGWSFWFPPLPFMQVIWAIGWGMIALAGLVWLPAPVVLGVGLAIVAGHNLLDPITPDQLGAAAPLWTVLHEGGPLFFNGAPVAFAAYPILPWIGVIAAGYGMGALFVRAPQLRERTILVLGALMLAAFVGLRLLNQYGDPTPWSARETWGDVIMAFLDVTKYPPSLQFTLVTLGVVFALWPLLARLRGRVASVLSTFGAVPFFFYVLHIYLVHALAMAANAATGRDPSGMLNFMVNSFTGAQGVQELGFSLPYVYVAWAIVLALLYPLCRYWQGLKARRRDWRLSYL